jgi:hypothetical protein
MRPLPRAAIADLKNKASRAEGYRAAVGTRLKQTEKEIKELEAEEELLDVVAALFRTLIDNEVNEGIEAVEKLQTEGLQAIFEDMDLKVKSEVTVKRNKVSVDLVTVQKQPDGVETEAPSTEAFGGSVTTVQSVLLRIIVILRQGMRPLLLLDESLVAVAENYVPAVGRFLSRLCERMGMDILAITHNAVLVEQAKTAYRIRKIGNTAQFTKIH